MTTTTDWCEHGMLPASMCACPQCAPDALVVRGEDVAYVAPPPGVPARPAVPPSFSDTPTGRLFDQAVQMYAVLEDAMQGVRTGPDQEGGKSAQEGRPLPLRAQVAEHRSLLLRGLRAWAAALQAATRSNVRAGGSVVTLALALDRGQRWLDPQVDDDVRTWVRRAHVLADLPRLRGRLPLAAHGDMPRDADHDLGLPALHRCDGIVHALLPADRDDVVALECAECKMRWDVAELPQAADQWLPVADAARVTGVPLRTLQRWVKWERVESRSSPAFVRLGEVLAQPV